MTPRYFVITGMGRTATLWLSQMLNQHPDTTVWHEVTKPDRPRRFVKWLLLETPVVGTADGFACYHIADLQRELHPQWLWVWREPWQWIRSFWARHPQVPFAQHVQRLFGMLEAALAMAEFYNIELTHWHMEDYTSEEGFRALAEHVGLSFGAELKMLPPSNARKDFGDIAHEACWTEQQKLYILEVIERLPRVLQASQLAYERMVNRDEKDV